MQRKFTFLHVALVAVVCLLVGGAIGAGVMAKSKAGKIADIIVARDLQLQALHEKHEAELQAAYAAVKAKAGEALDNISGEELGQVTQSEAEATIKEAGAAARSVLSRFRKSKAQTDSAGS